MQYSGVSGNSYIFLQFPTPSSVKPSYHSCTPSTSSVVGLKLLDAAAAMPSEVRRRARDEGIAHAAMASNEHARRPAAERRKPSLRRSRSRPASWQPACEPGTLALAEPVGCA
jgi:hypothetical protein